MRRRPYKRWVRDPYWLTAKYAGHCEGCGTRFGAGTSIFWFPNTRSAYGADCGCGEQRWREFGAAAADEAFYNGTSCY